VLCFFANFSFATVDKLKKKIVRELSKKKVNSDKDVSDTDDENTSMLEDNNV